MTDDAATPEAQPKGFFLGHVIRMHLKVRPMLFVAAVCGAVFMFGGAIIATITLTFLMVGHISHGHTVCLDTLRQQQRRNRQNALPHFAD